MNKILLWLQRNVRLSLASLILTMLTAWFAYDQYLVIHGGTIVQVLYNSEQSVENKHIQICKTQDSIRMFSPQIIPRIRNNSKYTISHLKIKHTIITPHSGDMSYQFDINPNYTFNGQKHEVQNNSLKTEFYYKEDAFYPTDETPDLFKSILFLPECGDSLFRWFDVESCVTWDASEPIYYKTRIIYITFNDNSSIYLSNDTITRYNQNDNLNSWVKDVSSFLNGKLQGNQDLLLFYHYYADSLSSKGTFTHLHSISNENIDSLNNDYYNNHKFIQNHHYSILNIPKQISVSFGRWFGFVLMTSFMLIVLIIAISINLSDSLSGHPNYLAFSYGASLIALIIGIIINIVYAYELLPLPLIHFFDSIGIVIIFLSIGVMIKYWTLSYKNHLRSKDWLELIWPWGYVVFVAVVSFCFFYEHSLL